MLNVPCAVYPLLHNFSVPPQMTDQSLQPFVLKTPTGSRWSGIQASLSHQVHQPVAEFQHLCLTMQMGQAEMLGTQNSCDLAEQQAYAKRS